MSKAEVKVARRYAKALFDSCNASQFDALSSALFAVAETTKQQDVKAALLNPSVKQSVRIDCLKEVAGCIFASESESAERTYLGNMFATLVENRRIDLLPELAEYFFGLVVSFKKLMQLEVTTAQTLKQQDFDLITSQIKEKMPAEFAAHLSIDWKTEKDLIGGMQVRVGDRLLDGSISGALNRIARELKGN